jgi:hypothetical protein
MKNNKRNIIILIIITLIVVYFSVKDDFNSIITAIVTVDIKWILVAFLFIILYWLFKSYSIYLFMKDSIHDIKFRQAFQLILRTQFFNAVTPFATGGQPYQIYYLKECGFRISGATGLILENFIVYQIALVTLGTIAVITNRIVHLFPNVAILQRLVTLGFAINLFVIILMFLVSFNKNFNKKVINFSINILTKLKLVKNKEETLDKWNSRINEFHECAGKLTKNKNLFIKTIIINLFALASLYMVPLFVLYSLGDFNSINIFFTIVVSSYVMLIGSFVPIPGGSGGLEYGFMAFYGNFVSGATLSAMMLIWRFITYYFGLIVGAISLNLKRVK